MDTFGTGVVDDATVAKIVSEVFDLRPRAIIRRLKLNRPVYRATSNYGHFGRAEFSWEKTDRVDEIKKALAKYTL